MHRSVNIIEDYLKNGGSLIECLDVLPSITYAPIEEQMDGILGCMENRLPKYLIPATSLIRRFIKKGILDVEEIYRPTWGPSKSDPLEKISLIDLKRAALPLSYRKPIKDLEGSWSKIIGEATWLINNKVISPRQELIAYMLANLKISDSTAEIRESITRLFETFRSNGERKLTGLKTFHDPYELVANAVSNLSPRNETLVAANLLLPVLKKPFECCNCCKSSAFTNLFHDGTLNYTRLMSRDRLLSKSKAGVALLSATQKNNSDMQNTIDQFFPFEYVSHRDLLLAFVSHLKRQQDHQSEMSDIVNNVYGDLILKDTTQKRWRLLRNRNITGAILSAMARVETSIRIQGLLTDVISDVISAIKPEDWQKALAFALPDNDRISLNGPIDAALKTLKALSLSSEFLTSDVLKTKISKLINAYESRISEEQVECSSRLKTLWSNFTHVGQQIDTKKEIEMKDIDIGDLLQALPDLDICTNEYKSLKTFLTQDNLEAEIGRVDVNAHPTRGRLLAQLLEMMEIADGIDNSLRNLAKRFIDNVAYEGYGAGALSLHPSKI